MVFFDIAPVGLLINKSIHSNEYFQTITMPLVMFDMHIDFFSVSFGIENIGYLFSYDYDSGLIIEGRYIN